MSATTTNLFHNLHSGQIACDQHAGMYLRTALAAHPNRAKFDTPLGTWARWSAADDLGWVAEFGEPAQCETCRWGH